MRRFFSAFPGAWPGAGLLLLRIALSTMLFAEAAAALLRSPPWQTTMFSASEILAGFLLLVGLWTPIGAIIVCLLQLGALLMTDRVELQLLRGAVGLSLLLLGPGVWSVDARLYGRRRVEITRFRRD